MYRQLIIILLLLFVSCNKSGNTNNPHPPDSTKIILDTIKIVQDTTKTDTVKIVRDTLNYLRHMDTAKFYIGTTEKTGKNDGPEVEMFLKSVGLKKGAQWCAAFVSYNLIAAKNVKEPTVRSGLARSFVTKKSIKAVDVLRKIKKIPIGSLVIWRKGTSISGHIGILNKDWIGEKGSTVEGNTSSGTAGSQYDGGGVYARTRKIEPANYFRITDFTLVAY